MADETHEFVCWHRSYPSKIWNRIDSYLTANTKPSSVSDDDSIQSKFNISFNDKSFTDQFIVKTGDDICITTDSTCKDIMNKKFLGKVHRIDVTINAWSEKNLNGRRDNLKTYNLTIQQRDPSIIFSEIDKEGVYSMQIIINELCEDATRPDLGGVINGILFPKVVFKGAIPNLTNFKNKSGFLNHLKEMCNRSTTKFEIVSYCSPHEINNLSAFYQIEISAA